MKQFLFSQKLSQENISAGGEGGSNLSFQPAKANWLLTLLGLGGFGVSLYALAAHLKSTVDPSALACDINETVNCTKVFGSAYGELAGIPLGAFGMSYFGILIAVAILPMTVEVSERWIAHWRLVVTGIGLVTSLILGYIGYVVIKAVCPVCTTVHVINIVAFVLAAMAYGKYKATANVAHPNAFLKLVSTSLVLATPPLLAGLLGPSFAPMIYGNKPSIESADAPSATPRATIDPQILAVAKNNFVGKGEDYRKGNDDAKVVMHMWSDLECPACKVAAQTIDAALSEYGKDKVLFVYRNYPLSSECNPEMQRSMHASACILAESARCAGAQGKFWEFKDWAFKGQDLSEGDKKQAYSKEGIMTQVATMGIDANRFRQCLDSHVELPKIKDDVAVGQKVGIPGTPTIVINGVKFSGDWRSTDSFIQAWERAAK